MENEEKTEHTHLRKSKINQNQIAGAIIIAGAIDIWCNITKRSTNTRIK